MRVLLPISTIELAAASFFVLAAPFLAFLKHYHYPLLRVEILLCFGALAAVAFTLAIVARRWWLVAPAVLALLLTLFIDSQFGVLRDGYRLAAVFALLGAALVPAITHATRVLSVAGAVVFVATVLKPIPAENRGPPVAPRSSDSASGPLIVHIVLDAHIGLTWLKEIGGGQLADDIEAFYFRYGFRLFRSAYAEHFDTHRSIGHAFNLSPGRFEPGLWSGPGVGYTWRLTRNAYFEELLSDGYTIRVHQSTFLDVCGDLPRTTCHTYDHTGIGALDSTPLSAVEKTEALLSIYFVRTQLYREASFQYRKVRSALLNAGVTLPSWQYRANTMGPLVALEELQHLTGEVATAKRGDFIMAHVLLPHSPYVFDAACHALPPSQWLTRMAAEAPYGAMNTPESRTLRYSRYAEQLRCVYRHLDRLLDAIPPDLARDAIIVVQGDHGARITISDPDPLPAHESTLSRSDFLDSYATLFAVRAPKLTPSSDDRPLSIACLMREIVEAGSEDISRANACRSQPEVFLSNAGGRIESWTLPSFDLKRAGTRPRVSTPKRSGRWESLK